MSRSHFAADSLAERNCRKDREADVAHAGHPQAQASAVPGVLVSLRAMASGTKTPRMIASREQDWPGEECSASGEDERREETHGVLQEREFPAKRQELLEADEANAQHKQGKDRPANQGRKQTGRHHDDRANEAALHDQEWLRRGGKEVTASTPPKRRSRRPNSSTAWRRSSAPKSGQSVEVKRSSA